MKAALILGILAISLMAGIATAAAACASGPFIKACGACTFDASGKMDQACWKSYESEGQTCLATSYPMMALKYELSGCEQLDTCVQRLSACKEAHKSGSDAVDCNNAAMIKCFTVADTCAERASAVCADGKTEEEAGFNNESAGGTIKEINETEKEPEQMSRREAANNVMDFVCGGPMVTVLLGFGLLFVRKE
jgi:hypothetical protein